MFLAGVSIEISGNLHAGAAPVQGLVSYRPLAHSGFGLWWREPDAYIYQRPKKNDAFPDRAA